MNQQNNSILAKYDIGKVCGTCGERKPLSQFPKKKYASGNMGHRFQCKDCYNNYMRERNQKEKERLYQQIRINRLWKPLGDSHE